MIQKGNNYEAQVLNNNQNISGDSWKALSFKQTLHKSTNLVSPAKNEYQFPYQLVSRQKIVSFARMKHLSLRRAIIQQQDQDLDWGNFDSNEMEELEPAYKEHVFKQKEKYKDFPISLNPFKQNKDQAKNKLIRKNC